MQILSGGFFTSVPGMFLEAELDARQVDGTYELSRKLFMEGDQVYVVRDSSLHAISVDPVYFSERSVVVRGIPDGEHILAQPIPGAYPGMTVSEIISEPSTSQSEDATNPE